MIVIVVHVKIASNRSSGVVDLRRSMKIIVAASSGFRISNKMATTTVTSINLFDVHKRDIDRRCIVVVS